MNLRGGIEFKNNSFSIVEKIGVFNHFGFFGQVTDGPISTGGYYGGLRCYIDNEIEFHNPSFTNCDTLNNITIAVINHANQTSIIYPNPTNDYLVINVFLNNIDHITIYNSLGVTVKLINTNFINVINYPSGIYFIQVVLNDKSVLFDKFLKK